MLFLLGKSVSLRIEDLSPKTRNIFLTRGKSVLKKALSLIVLGIWSLIFISNAKAANHFCSAIKNHEYNPSRNTLTVRLAKPVYTSEGNRTDLIDVITTEQKMMIKVAATRPETELCFEGLSIKTSKLLNTYLSKAAKQRVELFIHPLPDAVKLVHIPRKLRF